MKQRTILHNVKICACVAAILVLSGCIDSLDKSPVNSITEPGTDIDAITSASGELKVRGGTVGSTKASIDIQFDYDNGDTWIYLGDKVDTTYHKYAKFKIDTLKDTVIKSIKDDMTNLIKFDTLIVDKFDTTFQIVIDTIYKVSYGFQESLNKKPNFFMSQVTNRYKFKDLTPDTKYYFMIYGILEDKTWKIEGHFKTRE